MLDNSQRFARLRVMNKLTKNGTGEWIAHNDKGQYVGRITRDPSNNSWHFYDGRGNHTPMWDYQEARTELRDHAHA